MSRYIFTEDLTPFRVGELFNLEGEEFHHLIKVLHAKVSDELTCFDRKYTQCIVEIIQIHTRHVELKIKSIISGDERKKKINNPRIVLIQALPKWETWEFILEKACELGVSEIYPVLTKRVLSKEENKRYLKKDFLDQKWGRIDKILISAAKQSGNLSFPKVHLPTPYASCLKSLKSDGLRLFCFEKETKQSFKWVLSKKKSFETVYLFIGPEGGFEDEEAVNILNCGFESCGLGVNILKVETAFIWSVAALQYECS